jgi:hypothetical protein
MDVASSYIKMALAKSQLIFNPKSPRLSSRDWFLYRDDFAVRTATSVQDFKWRRRCKDDLPAVLFFRYMYCLSRLVSLSLRGIETG